MNLDYLFYPAKVDQGNVRGKRQPSHFQRNPLFLLSLLRSHLRRQEENQPLIKKLLRKLARKSVTFPLLQMKKILYVALAQIINMTRVTLKMNSMMTTLKTKTKGKVSYDLLTPPGFSRLIQNRKSAMKCRLKKKAEFEKLKDDFNELKEHKIVLNQQVSNRSRNSLINNFPS